MTPFIIYYGSRPFDQNVCLFVAFYSFLLYGYKSSHVTPHSQSDSCKQIELCNWVSQMNK